MKKKCQMNGKDDQLYWRYFESAAASTTHRKLQQQCVRVCVCVRACMPVGVCVRAHVQNGNREQVSTKV